MATGLLCDHAVIRDVQLACRTTLRDRPQCGFSVVHPNRSVYFYRAARCILMSTIIQNIAENWTVWLVTTVLIVAAIIDGAILKVPNWLTFPFIIGGWLHCSIAGGLEGFGWSLVGTCVGMCLLLFLRNVGGMGAGDVKLLAGIGAWLGATITLHAFAATAIVGGIMAVLMVLHRGEIYKHIAIGHQILAEWKSANSAKELSLVARERKPTMLLLPYGIPMAIGSIAYFAFAGLLI